MTFPFHIIMSNILGLVECELPNNATIDLKIKKVMKFTLNFPISYF